MNIISERLQSPDNDSAGKPKIPRFKSKRALQRSALMLDRDGKVRIRDANNNLPVGPQDLPRALMEDDMVRTRKRRVSQSNQEQIADRVRQKMAEKEIDITQLAEKLLIPELQLSRLLGGNRSWTLRLLFETADALDVTVQELDPECNDSLRTTLDHLELRGDVPQLRVLHTFLQEFPKITDPEDLRALVQVLRSFADKAQEAAA